MIETNFDFDVQKWFQNLDISWKRIFKRALDIAHNPSKDEIIAILNLEEIDCSNPYVVSLEPLQHLTKLRKVNCSKTNIASLDKLKELPFIEELDCSNTKITSLEPLAGFYHLRSLKCNNTLIKNIEPVKNLPNLTEVNYTETPYQNFGADGDLDDMFENAARVIVQNQTGSTSLIQRRFKLGYNRAGRLMDQLESAGIVGENLGSKAREVLVKTEAELEPILMRIRGYDGGNNYPYRRSKAIVTISYDDIEVPVIEEAEPIIITQFERKSTYWTEKRIYQFVALGLFIAIVVFCYLIFK